MNEEEAKKTLKTMKENIDKKYLKSRNSVAIEKVLNLIQIQQAEIEHQKEKRENQKKELSILNEKQKEFNKLRNTVNSYKGQFKRQQAEIDLLKDFKEIAESKVTDLNPIGLARTNQLLSRQCHKLQEENEKKDKIIDLMAEEISKSIVNTCPFADYNVDLDCENKCKDDYKACWKQYFEYKVEEDR